MDKPESCRDCPLFRSPGPIPSELNDRAAWDLEGDADVLFTSEAPGRVEIENGRPFQNPRGAGRILRQSLRQMDITSFGILNVWRCRPPGNKLPDGEVPGEFCRNKFKEELTKFNQKITVPLGAVGLNVLTEYPMSIMKVRGRTFSVNFNGSNLLLLPMLHPAFLMRQRGWWRDWELDMEKLKRYLDTGKLDYIPLSKRIVHQAKTTSDISTFIKILHTYKTLSCDIETTSFNMPWEGGVIISAAFSISPTEAYAIPWRLVSQTLHAEIKNLLEDRSIRWLWYNGPYDVQFFWAEGIGARIDGDAMLEMHLLDERLNVHSLKKDAGIFLDAPDWEEGIKKYKIPNNTSQEAMDGWRNIPEDELLEYNGQDTNHTIHLSSVAREQLGTELCKYADELLVPAYGMLARARRVGIRVDMYKVKELRDTFAPVLNELEQVLIELSGDSLFNPRSSQQKLALLKKRGLNVQNTRKGTLQQFEGDEAVDAMVAYSEAHKMYSTYVVGIVDDISDDLRVHPDWRLPAETGRLRCSDPNILGMPRKAEEQEHRWKRRIKEMFIADVNTLLMHIDRKQSEVRCACFLSGDETLAKILRSGRDIHGEVAMLMYGDGFTHEQRVWAKMVVFGLIYNREAPSLARQLTAIARDEYRRAHPNAKSGWHVWTIREAQAMIDEFFKQMPRLLEWKGGVMKEALDTGELTSFFKRKRRFGLITWENKKEVENESVNFLPSSMSSDLNLMSCLETMRQFGKYGVEVLAPIHDAGLLRIPKNHDGLADEIAGMWTELVPKILGTDLPFPVDVTVGERWSDL